VNARATVAGPKYAFASPAQSRFFDVGEGRLTFENWSSTCAF
jgi:hypothetical protein